MADNRLLLVCLACRQVLPIAKFWYHSGWERNEQHEDIGPFLQQHEQTCEVPAGAPGLFGVEYEAPPPTI